MLHRSYNDGVYCFCAVGGLLNLLGTTVLTSLAWGEGTIIGETGLLREERSERGMEIGRPWLMTAWLTVYNIQFIWLLYCISFLFRELAIARLLYTALPPFVHILYLLANMCVSAWLLLLVSSSNNNNNNNNVNASWSGLVPLAAGSVSISTTASSTSTASSAAAYAVTGLLLGSTSTTTTASAATSTSTSAATSTATTAGLLLLALGAALMHLVVVLLLRAHRAACPRLRHVAPRDYWATRLLAHNGAAVHAAAMAALLLYQITILVLDHTSLPLPWLRPLFLGLLSLYVVTWFLLDVFGRWSLHSWVLSPYIAIFLLCIASLILHGAGAGAVGAGVVAVAGAGAGDTAAVAGAGIGAGVAGAGADVAGAGAAVSSSTGVAAHVALASILGLACVGMTLVKVRMALRAERARYDRTLLDEEDVMLTSLDQSELDKVERIDMIAKMFESDYS